MYVIIENFKTGWHGITIGIKHDEIDILIERLNLIKNKPEQHFHISSNYVGDGGIGDIEIYILPEDQNSNMFITGPLIEPNG